MKRRDLVFNAGKIAISGMIMPFISIGKALAFSAVRGFNTHQAIVDVSYNLLRRNGYIGGFPSKDLILKHDVVYPTQLNEWGTGPDADDASLYSWHYYNPLTRQGGAPYAVQQHVEDYVFRMINNPGHDAIPELISWGAHFLVDMHVPYHIFGVPGRMARKSFQNGHFGLSEEYSGPSWLYGIRKPPVGWGGGRNFKLALAEFANTKGDLIDWFDAWYYNGFPKTVINSSHVEWEVWVDMMVQPLWAFVGNTMRYHAWGNPVLKFGQKPWEIVGAKARDFTKDCAILTLKGLKNYYKEKDCAVKAAVAAVNTLFLGTTTRLELTCERRGSVLVAKVRNGNSESVDFVKLRFDVNGKKKVINGVGIGAKRMREYPLRIPGNGEVKGHVEIITHFKKIPDLGYKKFNFRFGKSYTDPFGQDDWESGSTPSRPDVGDPYDRAWTGNWKVKVRRRKSWGDKKWHTTDESYRIVVKKDGNFSVNTIAGNMNSRSYRGKIDQRGVIVYSKNDSVEITEVKLWKTGSKTFEGELNILNISNRSLYTEQTMKGVFQE